MRIKLSRPGGSRTSPRFCPRFVLTVLVTPMLEARRQPRPDWPDSLQQRLRSPSWRLPTAYRTLTWALASFDYEAGGAAATGARFIGSNCPSRQAAPRGPDPGKLTVKVLELQSCDVRLLCRMLFLNVRPEQRNGRLLRKARRPVISKSMVRSSMTRIDLIRVVEMQLTGGPSATQTDRLATSFWDCTQLANVNANAPVHASLDNVMYNAFPQQSGPFDIS